MNQLDKKYLRRQIKNMRLVLSSEERTSASDSIFDRLEQTAQFLMSSRILMYHALPDEVETRRFLNKWSAKKSFFLPRVNGVNLDILPYDQSRLELGSFHIEEPTGDDLVDPGSIDLIVVPAVAYDRAGNRLGRGKGYYDRLLATTDAVTIGVAYDFQIVDKLPAEPHDVPVDMIITDKAVYIASKP